MRKGGLLLTCVFISLLCSGCPWMATVFVEAEDTEMDVGDTQLLIAFSSSWLDLSFAWVSDNPGVARVDGDGWVTAVAPGTARITATGRFSNRSASIQITVREEGEPSETLTLFDQLWNTFDQEYSYFTYKGIDWNDVRQRHRPNFINDLPTENFVALIADMLDELHDWHVYVQRPDGEAFGYSGEYEINYPSRLMPRYANGGVYTTLGDDVIFHATVGENLAYIVVDTLDSQRFASVSDQDIENLFALYADADGMILDIRANNGGNENNAAKIASRFTDFAVTYGYTETRTGSGHDDFGPLVEKTLDPGEGTHFNGDTVLLIGQRCMSSAEWFTLMMRACPGVMLIGDTTRGASANPVVHSLSNGVNFAVSRWIAYTDDMQGIEDNGIDPDFLINPADSFDDEHDYVLEFAIDFLSK